MDTPRRGGDWLPGLLRADRAVLLPVALLASIALLVLALSVVTSRTLERQRLVSTRALREIAEMGAWGFARRAQSNVVGIAMTYASVENALGSPERGPSLARLARASDSLTRCNCATFLPALGFATGRFGVPGSVKYAPASSIARLDSARRAQLAGEFAALTPDTNRVVTLEYRGTRERPVLFILVALARVYQQGDRTRFFVLDLDLAEFQRELLDALLNSMLILPNTLVGKTTSREVGEVRLIVTGSDTIWRSTPRYASGISGTAWMGPYQRLGVQLELSDKAIGSILLGAMPERNLAFEWGMPLLALLLTGATALTLHRAQSLARARAQFAASVTHELRTPLTHILLNAETLQLERVPDAAERERVTRTLVREARRLVYLIENVLHFSRAERRLVRVLPRRLRLDLLIAEHADHLSAMADAAGVPLAVHGVDPVWVRADSAALQLVLTNVIDNALHYGRGTPVSLTVELGATGVGVILVDDGGDGIPPADRARVLKAFARMPGAELVHPTGSGIGLAVVDELMRAMSGTVALESSPRGGLRIRLALPGAPPQESLP